MSSGVRFPIFKNSDVFTYEEILYELLHLSEESVDKCLSICREVQHILLSSLNEEPIILTTSEHSVELRVKHFDEKIGLKHFEQVATKVKGRYELTFIDFKLPKEGLKRFQQRQTPRQRSDYIASLNLNLEKKNEKISSLIEAKNYLMNFIVHEIRNPLSTIIGYSNILEEDPHAIPIEDAVEVFKRQSLDIKRLVDEVLDFSKLESNKLQVKNERTNILGFAQDFAESSSMIVKAKNLSWIFDTETESIKNTFVMIDSFRLKQILNNFLSNSLKFTKEGSISFEVKLKSDNVILSISDTGKGFDSEFKAKLFGEFSQESTEVSKDFGGSGLGLNIAKSLASLMNSSLDAESEVGKGACFKIIIPVLFDDEHAI